MGRNVKPAPGTPKPIQRILTTLNFGQNDVTISAVNMLKTKLNVIGPGTSSNGGNAVSWYAYLLNSTTVRFQSSLGGGATIGVSLEVEETY